MYTIKWRKKDEMQSIFSDKRKEPIKHKNSKIAEKVKTKIPYIIYVLCNIDAMLTFYISSVILLNQIIPKFTKKI